MSKGWKGGSTSEWRKLREIVFKRDGAICVQCGEDERTKLHIDHIIPKRLVGDSPNAFRLAFELTASGSPAREKRNTFVKCVDNLRLL